MSANEKHQCLYHMYERSRTRKTIYRCIHPECSHYISRELLEGKKALCFNCKNPFILNWAQLRNKRPVCEFCSKSPKAGALREIRDTLLKQVVENELPEELKEIFDDK